MAIKLNERQEKIVAMVKSHGPITSEEIAARLGLKRATLRPDLTLLVLSGILEARPRVGYFYSGKKTSTAVKEQLQSLLVKDVKSVPVVVAENASVYDAAVVMFTEDAGTLFVVRTGGLLEGVVSRKDLLRIALGQTDVKQIPVSVIMTRMPNIICTVPEETVFDAAVKLIQHQVDALPVVVKEDEERKLEVVGRFSKTTLARIFVEMGQD